MNRLEVPISKGDGVPKRLKQMAQTFLMIRSQKKLEFSQSYCWKYWDRKINVAEVLSSTASFVLDGMAGNAHLESVTNTILWVDMISK